ncbi:MAG: hypothetical protein OEZ59_04280 [Deltaproteobacteria bacterium]|nr:hypothetical protein [Deltaproteobacteria bacterium]
MLDIKIQKNEEMEAQVMDALPADVDLDVFKRLMAEIETGAELVGDLSEE